MNKPLSIAAVVLTLGAGCSDFGTGGTGELVVPREKLHEIQAINFPHRATTQPLTTPTTTVTSLPSTQRAGAQEVRLSIEEARTSALANNLDLRVELLGPAIARAALSEEQARFEALFVTSAAYSRSDTPTASQLSGSQNENFSITPGVEVPLRTGGTIRLDVPLERSETNNQFSTLNPAYESDAAITLSQPLLRGFGVAANAAQIRVAFYEYQQAQARTKLEVIRVLANVDRVYWRLYAAREELRVRKQEYDLAVEQLRRARRQVEVGTAAKVEIVRAESGVADQVEALIAADTAVRERERELKRILNAPDLEIGSSEILVPASEPRPVAYQLDPSRLAEQAMEQRMELLELELQIAQEVANIALARNAMLPLVTVDYTYNINGLGPSFDDSFQQTRTADFNDHRLGLRLEVPLGNQAARSRLRQALLSRVQTLATREQRELLIREEVFNAVDQLETNWQRYVAAVERVRLAEAVLAVEIRQFEQGLRTSRDVLDAQTNLADARSAAVAALSDHQISQVDIAFATGTILGATNIIWDAPEPPLR